LGRNGHEASAPPSRKFHEREGIRSLGYPVNHAALNTQQLRHPPGDGTAGSASAAMGRMHLARHIVAAPSAPSACARPAARKTPCAAWRNFGESVPMLVLPMGYARKACKQSSRTSIPASQKSFAKSLRPSISLIEVGTFPPRFHKG